MTQSVFGQEITESITDFESVRDRINCRLVNASQNAENLSGRPHTMMGELAVTYHVELGKSERGSVSAPITNHLMEMYGVDTEQLHGIALGNMPHLSPPRFKGMSETMAELLLPDAMANGMSREEAERVVGGIFQPEQDEMMYVLSNEEKLHGATAILDKEIMDEVTAKLGREYYILPSSIHEVLIVPKTEEMDLKSLESMVRDVNATQVSPEERLSDSVYAYDVKTHSLFRADQVMEQLQEKKPSISDALRAPLPETASHAIRPPVAGGDAR